MLIFKGREGLMKKIITVIFCLIMTFAVFPVYAGASPEEIPEGHGCEKREMITNEDGKYRIIITSVSSMRIKAGIS